MKQFKEQDYTINVCTDLQEWANEFYEIPDGAVVEQVDEDNTGCAGFAQPEDNEIWVFVALPYELSDLKEVIAHEIGHCVVMKYPDNPDENPENDELHELKADFYMNYYMTVDAIVKRVQEIVGAAPVPNGFIQWKGTDVCMDVRCKCGHSFHVDGEFAYHVKCPNCYVVLKCNSRIEMIPLDHQP